MRVLTGYGLMWTCHERKMPIILFTLFSGFSHIYYPIKDGRRVSTYKAFLEPIRNRPSLTIYKYSVVNKVITLYFLYERK